MSKCSKFIILLATLPLWNFAQAQSIILSEEYLSEASKKGSPQLDQIEAAFLSAEVRAGQTKEMFAPEVFGQAVYAETNEKAIIPFIPIWSPVKQGQIGVRKNLSSGFYTEAAVTTDQRSAISPIGKYRNITTSTLSFTMQMDLW